jgi:DNA-binding response OmpR family regulator
MAEQRVPRIFIAEDDEGILDLLVTRMRIAGYHTAQERDGLAALEAIRRLRPSACILDVNMPKLDGFAVCQQLKHEPATASIKIVMLTARGADADRARGREAGADDYFVKPFSPVQLLNKVYALLE